MDWTRFLALGLIALSYGIALLLNAYGFLAVFAAGLSVRRIEREHSDIAPPADVAEAGRSAEEQATDPDASIVLHGVSVTPLIQRYSARAGNRQRK